MVSLPFLYFLDLRSILSSKVFNVNLTQRQFLKLFSNLRPARHERRHFQTMTVSSSSKVRMLLKLRHKKYLVKMTQKQPDITLLILSFKCECDLCRVKEKDGK